MRTDSTTYFCVYPNALSSEHPNSPTALPQNGSVAPSSLEQEVDWWLTPFGLETTHTAASGLNHLQESILTCDFVTCHG